MELSQIITAGDIPESKITSGNGFISNMINHILKQESKPILKLMNQALDAVSECGYNDAMLAVVNKQKVFKDNFNFTNDLEEAIEKVTESVTSDDTEIFFYLKKAGEQLEHLIELRISVYNEYYDVKIEIASAVQNPVTKIDCSQYCQALKDQANNTFYSSCEKEFSNEVDHISTALHNALDYEISTGRTKRNIYIFKTWQPDVMAKVLPKIVNPKRYLPRHFNQKFKKFDYHHNYKNDYSFFDYFMFYFIKKSYAVGQIYYDEKGALFRAEDLQSIPEIEQNIRDFESYVELLSHEKNDLPFTEDDHLFADNEVQLNYDEPCMKDVTDQVEERTECSDSILTSSASSETPDTDSGG